MKIINQIQRPENLTREEVGGKGLNLLRLSYASRELGTFHVPEFFIIPCDYSSLESQEIQESFDALQKPIIVRSSSPLEDGEKATFAGLFLSCENNSTFEEFLISVNKIRQSVYSNKVKRYTDKMKLSFSNAMALIVQKQLVKPCLRGIVQLEKNKSITELINRDNHKWSDTTEYQFLKEYGHFTPYFEEHDYISEGEIHTLTQEALRAKEHLNLEGIVQVEFCLYSSQYPHFVQIRKLPSGKNTLGKVYSVNAPIAKDLNAGLVSLELAENPGQDVKLYRYDFNKSEWQELETKLEGSKLFSKATGAGIFAVLVTRK